MNFVNDIFVNLWNKFKDKWPLYTGSSQTEDIWYVYKWKEALIPCRKQDRTVLVHTDSLYWKEGSFNWNKQHYLCTHYKNKEENKQKTKCEIKLLTD